MTRFAATWWDPTHADAGRRARSLEAGILASQVNARFIIRRPGWTVMTWGDAVGMARLVGGDGVIVGRIFDTQGLGGIDALACRSLVQPSDFRAICTLLAERCWGAYVLLWADPANQAAVAFRDPLGALDCVSWEDDGLRVITSDARTCVQAQRSLVVGIDWDAVGHGLTDPTTMIDSSLLTGMVSIAAGEAVEFQQRSARRTSFWNAAAFAKRPSGPALPASAIRDTVRECIAHWRTDGAGLACEISGGLDSAIVAATLAECQSVIAGYHYFTRDAVGDERYYARSVAHHIDVALVETPMPVRTLSDGDLQDLPVGNRPAIGAVSLFHDRDLVARAREAGATMLFTGQGGDAVFFQHAAIEIAGDCQGTWRQQVSQLAALSQWTGHSFWSALIMRLVRIRSQNRLVAPSFLVRTPKRTTRSPAWVGDITDLSPAKRLHVEALFRSRLSFGTSWSSEAMDVVHPLLSQPIIETALALPVMALTEEFRDRGLARRAFAPDLPATLVNRYGKGALTPYFGQCLARSLPFLREFLLDGLLAEHDVVARDRLDAALDVDYLMQNDIYPELIWLVLTEHWARGWKGVLMPSRGGLDGLDAGT